MILASSHQAECNHTRSSEYLNPYEAPPLILKELFKSWRLRSTLPENGLEFQEQDFSATYQIRPDQALLEFCNSDQLATKCLTNDSLQLQRVYSSKKIPASLHEIVQDPLLLIPLLSSILTGSLLGLIVAPNLLPPIVQKELLSRLLHRDLSNPDHQTNLHLHYEISYPHGGKSFFSENPTSVKFISKDQIAHKNLDCKKALEKKLRWLTLGGQYDWSRKEYPKNKNPKFPHDISKLIVGLFPCIKPQAAIVNLYSPGDTLSLHRDVSEEVDRGLVSISLGCDAYFIIGLQNKDTMEIESEVLLLHSGDVLYMTQESRFAWHGVPMILENTCPEYLKNWPGDEFPTWKDWIKKKRINLNVRQILDESNQTEC
ncbi:Alpha-ketoglutarate-dependent dioxygenase abh1 [Golovinomyces cichoracearum]|uniref:mRNA N(6)-methyladenine demethylase n=1 Tax=Golovinomyces cichoracearum TaxID=62708 RepID=A0A420HB32_9PEZI|nr:Alpha-ketoglutarate-dependent dioxygenase abh1 [Golovinomyces cichoracearum]